MSQYQDSRQGGTDPELMAELDGKYRQYREGDEPSDRQKQLDELYALRAELLQHKGGQESDDEDPAPPEKTLVLRRHR